MMCFGKVVLKCLYVVGMTRASQKGPSLEVSSSDVCSCCDDKKQKAVGNVLFVGMGVLIQLQMLS